MARRTMLVFNPFASMLPNLNKIIAEARTINNVTTDVTVHGAEFQQPVCIGLSNSILAADAPHDVLVEQLTIRGLTLQDCTIG